MHVLRACTHAAVKVLYRGEKFTPNWGTRDPELFFGNLKFGAERPRTPFVPMTVQYCNLTIIIYNDKMKHAMVLCMLSIRKH